MTGLLFLGVIKSEFISSQSQSSAPAMRESMSTFSATCRARSRLTGERYACLRLGVCLGKAVTFFALSGVRGGGTQVAALCRRGGCGAGTGAPPSSSAKISSRRLLSSASVRLIGGILGSSGGRVEGVVEPYRALGSFTTRARCLPSLFPIDAIT